MKTGWFDKNGREILEKDILIFRKDGIKYEIYPTKWGYSLWPDDKRRYNSLEYNLFSEQPLYKINGEYKGLSKMKVLE